MGLWWALQRGYDGFITIDGNDKDSIEDVPKFISKLQEGFDFIQGSRFRRGGKAINTPFIRHVALKFMHAPLISLSAGQWFTDTTNAYRAYSRHYLEHPEVQHRGGRRQPPRGGRSGKGAGTPVPHGHRTGAGRDDGSPYSERA